MDVPLPVFGIVGYAFIILLSIVRHRFLVYRGWATLGIFGCALFGFVFSVFLTYVEFFVLYAICPWCLVSAGAMTGIFIFSVRDLING